MATRFRRSANASEVNPTLTTGWEVSTGVTRRHATTDTADVDTTATAVNPSGAGTGVANDDYCHGQLVSYRLTPGQTIGGGGVTFKGQWKAREASGLTDARAQVVVRIVNDDGTVRGTLVNFDTSALSHEFVISSNAPENRQFPIGGAVATTAVGPTQWGDRLVIEFGHRNHGTNTGAVRIQGNEAGTSDLPEDETSTATNWGWFEISQDLLFGYAASDTGVGTDSLTTQEKQFDDTGVGADFVDTLDRQYDDTGVGTDFVSVLDRQYGDSGIGDDQGGLLFPPINVTDSGVAVDTAAVTVDPKPGRYHIGKFQTGEAKYTIENEIIRHEQVTEGGTRPNVVVVDGNDDSWTEYDRDDLIQRDTAINIYLDLPELKTPGEVRQRAVEELQLAQRRNSPGGEAVWMPWFGKGDNIYWVDEDHNKYETRIEGLSIDFNMSDKPFQRVMLDTGILVFCPPDEAEGVFVARDLFNRDTADGLGTALIGGSWQVYSA